MGVEGVIDRLIAAGRSLLDGNWNVTAFEKWRRRALECLRAFFGADHAYTLYFREFVRHAEKSQLLTGTGLLFAAREQLAVNGVNR